MRCAIWRSSISERVLITIGQGGADCFTCFSIIGVVLIHCFVESWITGLLRIFFAYSVAFCASLSAASSLALIFLKFAQPDNKKEDINKQSNFLFMFNYLMEYAKYYLLVARIIQIRQFYRDYQGLD